MKTVITGVIAEIIIHYDVTMNATIYLAHSLELPVQPYKIKTCSYGSVYRFTIKWLLIS